LVQTQAVTVPFTVTVLLSYAAFPWCANSEPENGKSATATSKPIISLFLIPASLSVPGWPKPAIKKAARFYQEFLAARNSRKTAVNPLLAQQQAGQPGQF
jgi:hypothetical protein